jgi:uncharacterized protein YecE (DUF72 family)
MAPVKKTELLIGTSGWTYDGWRRSFYPEDIPKRCWLSYYASVFSSAEINGSFYRTPSLEAVRRWRDETPSDFIYAWKAFKFITTGNGSRRSAGIDRSDENAPQGTRTEGCGRLVSTSATVRQGRASAALISQDAVQRISFCVQVSRPRLV